MHFAWFCSISRSSCTVQLYSVDLLVTWTVRMVLRTSCSDILMDMCRKTHSATTDRLLYSVWTKRIIEQMIAILRYIWATLATTHTCTHIQHPYKYHTLWLALEIGGTWVKYICTVLTYLQLDLPRSIYLLERVHRCLLDTAMQWDHQHWPVFRSPPKW